MSSASFRSCAASVRCRRGRAFLRSVFWMRCARTKKRASASCALCSRRASAKRVLTMRFTSSLSNACSTLRRSCLLHTRLPTQRSRISPMPESAVPVKGTRPEGAVTESDASKKVREMFTQIAPRYDLLNHLLSLQLDRLWRARTARRLQSILDRPDALVLDLCCGTGDLAFALARAGKARMAGVDLSHPLLVRARDKLA